MSSLNSDISPSFAYCRDYQSKSAHAHAHVHAHAHTHTRTRRKTSDTVVSSGSTGRPAKVCVTEKTPHPRDLTQWQLAVTHRPSSTPPLLHSAVGLGVSLVRPLTDPQIHYIFSSMRTPLQMSGFGCFSHTRGLGDSRGTGGQPGDSRGTAGGLGDMLA
jgi:hypothetical protein